MRFTRRELGMILATRGARAEGDGNNAFLEFRFRITPELLKEMMDGEFIFSDGRHAKLDGIFVSDDGLALPEMAIVGQGADKLAP